MRHLMQLTAADVSPTRDAILKHLAMTAADPVSARLDQLIGQAAQIFDQKAAPAAIFHRISPDDFATVYEGSGWNAPASPLDEIYPRADALALFAGTLGQAIDRAIGSLFQSGDPALGYVLDVTAAGAADRLADLAAERFLSSLHRAPADLRVLPYSPGYCGWHVSGQRALFAHLHPDEIGVALTTGCLMDPLKSVSGVLVAGRAAVHRFRPTYPFCDACTTHECRTRMASVRA